MEGFGPALGVFAQGRAAHLSGPVGVHCPKAFRVSSGLVDVFPTVIDDSTVRQHRGARFAERAGRQRLHVPPVAVHVVQVLHREVVGSIAEDAVLATGRCEHDPAIGQVTRMHIVRAMMIAGAQLIAIDEFRLLGRGKC